MYNGLAFFFCKVGEANFEVCLCLFWLCQDVFQNNGIERALHSSSLLILAPPSWRVSISSYTVTKQKCDDCSSLLCMGWRSPETCPPKNGPQEKWSPEKWSRGKMVPGKMVPEKNGPRKIGPQKNLLQKLFSVKRMLGNLNDFFIFINWFHYTHTKICTKL